MKKGMSRKKHSSQAKAPSSADLLRIHKRVVLFNSREVKAIDAYCKKYAVHNKSKFMRELILSAVIKKFEADYPTLF